jgi:lipopolysaccharide/colanic/teichoic acid biosynthesis glycosyltransferase
LTAGGITSDAKIKGWLSLPDELVEGDLRQNDLWEIWFDEDAFAYTRQFSIDELGPW